MIWDVRDIFSVFFTFGKTVLKIESKFYFLKAISLTKCYQIFHVPKRQMFLS